MITQNKFLTARGVSLDDFSELEHFSHCLSSRQSCVRRALCLLENPNKNYDKMYIKYEPTIALIAYKAVQQFWIVINR